MGTVHEVLLPVPEESRQGVCRYHDVLREYDVQEIVDLEREVS